MNSLSVFLYWAGVVDNLRGIAAFWGIITSTALLAWSIALIVCVGCAISDRTLQNWVDFKSNVRPLVYIGCFIWVLSGIVYSFAPSANTMYAIASSQVGEQIIKSDAVQGVTSNATKALNAWIDRQLNPQENKK